MILNHLWGIYAHPKEEWHTIEQRHESLFYSMTHILIISAIPSLMGYYSSVYLGWSIGVGDKIFLSQQDALIMGAALYIGLIGGVFGLTYLVHWMAKTFDSDPTYTQSLELSAYTATPIFMVALAAFYPTLWFVMLIGLIGLTYSVYLLYTGVPIIMHIPEEEGFVYSSSVVTCGLILLVVLMTGSVVLWGWVFSPI